MELDDEDDFKTPNHCSISSSKDTAVSYEAVESIPSCSKDSSDNTEKLLTEPDPSCSVETDDCKIVCSNHESLCNIVKTVQSQVSLLADSNCKKDYCSTFVTQFMEFFVNALQENIVINGVPWTFDGKSSTSPEEEGPSMAVDVLHTKLTEVVSKVTYKRKYCPQQCCRILRCTHKNELQNLKAAKVKSNPQPPVSVDSLLDLKTNPFVEFCKEFKSHKQELQESRKVQRNMLLQLKIAADIKKTNQNQSCS